MTEDDVARRALAKSIRESRLREIQRNEVLRGLMSTAAGRAWVHDKLAAAGVAHTPFIASDPHLTSFNCGMQNFGLMILAEVMAAAPNEYILMMKENAPDGPANQLRDDRADDTDDGDRVNRDSGED